MPSSREAYEVTDHSRLDGDFATAANVRLPNEVDICGFKSDGRFSNTELAADCVEKLRSQKLRLFREMAADPKIGGRLPSSRTKRAVDWHSPELANPLLKQKNEADLARLNVVIEKHLARFGHLEAPEFSWS